ncbi:holo-[acyl-carrier-protein] synthase [Aureococcus anophagefferens]|nr:holo-[acyl-carrier-protein] synthase [Aureococcus anophagefferens]
MRARRRVRDRRRPLRVAARLSEFEVDGATETSKQFNWLVDTLVREEAERASVRRFKFEADQKRALLARLLARYCCRAVVGAECTIARTDGGKPHAYPVPAAAAAAAPNFNFNVSHEGDYVVAATEPRALCGADVCSADHLCRAGPPTRDQLRNLADAFAADEWAAVDAIDDAALRFNAFKVLWSCKEAVVKARGDGIVFDLNRVSALVKFDGVPDRRWRVDVDVLDAAHVASVARGPVAAMKDKAGRFRSTMRDPARGAEDSGAWRAELAEPRPPFTVLTVADLVPPRRRAEYDALCGAPARVTPC